MREDMAKVIVERPRHRAGSFGKRRPDPLDNAPKHKGMRRFHKERGGWRELNENLEPLRRYLGRQVGRPWDKVYSEVCANLKVTSTVQQHVRDHLKDYVELHPRLDMKRRWGVRSDLWLQDYYVDPIDGLLKRTDKTSVEKFRKRVERGT